MGLIDNVKKHLLKENGEISTSAEASDAKALPHAEDLPSTVQPLTSNDRQVAELRRAFAGQEWDSAPEVTADIYVWRKADHYTRDWLPDRGYKVLESAIFDDCIGYRCTRKGHAYTVFMYAYGEQKTVFPNGEYCSRLKSLEFAQNSTILVIYLKVDREVNGSDIVYKVGHYGGSTSEPELWRLNDIDGMPILEYYPRREMMEQTWQFMYAFNREDTDIYDCIMTDETPSIECSFESFKASDSAFYSTLKRLHEEYGDMKLGYARVNDAVYCSVPYLEGLGFFSWSSGPANRIHSMVCHPFEGGKLKIKEFIKTDLREPDKLFAYIPKLVSAAALPPVPTERFAVKLFFDNGECRKYVLPINMADEKAEFTSYMHHLFSDEIWNSAGVVPMHESRYDGYPACGAALMFKNGFHAAGTRCYLESEPYSEPEMTDEIVYSDAVYQVRKIWKWDVKALHEDRETGLLHVLISGQAFNWYGKSVFASIDGKRMTSLTFDMTDNFSDGLARVYIYDHGYGFVDREMKLVIPMKYDKADDFKNGKAKVCLGDRWIFIDKAGRETEIGSNCKHSNYQEVCEYSEGLCRVSTLKLRLEDLAYYSDYEGIAGIWGYVDEAGDEIISPQYIYACDFYGGIAIVAKGKWTIDPKWDNEYNQGFYWTEEELWGAIDRDGCEVIPFIFDEIGYFDGRFDIFMAHYGGWKDGRWGIIDKSGNWLVKPIFEGLSYESRNDLIVFYSENPDAADYDVPMGIYDLASRRVLFEPQFFRLHFLKNGDMLVKVFDEELGRIIEKIIDLTGKERFKSIYSSIYTWNEPYEVEILDNGCEKHGLIDKNGNVILPCIYEVPWNGIMHEHKKILFEENGKQGIKDYDGSIIVPPEYLEIICTSQLFLTVRAGNADKCDEFENDDEELLITDRPKGRYKEGLITHDGKTVIPAKYERIGWCSDHRHFFGCSEGCCEMYVIEDRIAES